MSDAWIIVITIIVITIIQESGIERHENSHVSFSNSYNYNNYPRTIAGKFDLHNKNTLQII